MPSMTDTEQRIGAALVAARAAGVPWKVLQRQTGYGRTRLWMLWRAAGGRSTKSSSKIGGTETE